MPRLLVFVVAKSPRSGAVKTRLSPLLSLDEAALVYRAFLVDCVELAAAVPSASVRVICPDSVMASELEAIVPGGCPVIAQKRPGLSAALEECFRTGIAEGFTAVTVLASDNPTLPSTLVERAFQLLESYDVVFGPAEDGGYYLVAAGATFPELFHDMVWSTDQVLAETLQRCRLAGLRAAMLPEWYDVDTPDALLALMSRLESLPATVAPATRAALAETSLGLDRSSGTPTSNGRANSTAMPASSERQLP